MNPRRPKPRMLAPCECRTLDQVCKLRTDHHDLRGFWIITDSFKVTICAQLNGQEVTQKIQMSPARFNRLVAWWTKKQKVRK
jgi:hypothetical protein